jgi:hypothetical protein
MRSLFSYQTPSSSLLPTLLVSMLAMACSGATTSDDIGGAGGDPEVTARADGSGGESAGTGGTSADPDDQSATGGCPLILLSAVSVTVADEEGSPLSASVSARVDGGEAYECTEWVRGEYDCQDRGGGTYVVTAQVGDFTEEATVELESDGCGVTTTESIEFIFAEPGPIGGCTTILMSAVNVSVRDGAGEPLSASVSARVEGREANECMEQEPGAYSCFEQGGGTYVVTAQVGDVTQSVSVELESDGCHVTMTESVEFVFE